MNITEQALKKAANDLTAFKLLLNPQYQQAPHLQLLDAALTEVVRYLETGNGIQKLIVEMPPRHGKSMAVSQYLPAWVLGRNPWVRIILACYGATLAEDHSRFARNLLDDPYYKATFPYVQLDPDNQKVDNWSVHAPNGVTGGMIAGGLGGAFTGKGAHLLIIDDPIKSRAEAESKAVRDGVWQAYTNDLLSRFNDHRRAAQIIMATRWHEDDLTGRILKSEEEGWYRLRLPALAEEKDPLGRAEGEALWPERMDKKWLEATAALIGSYAFASLYQQRPIPRGETVFDTDKIEIIDYAPPCAQKVRYYDLAVSIKKTADYTVGALIGVDDFENIIVYDVWRDRVKSPDMLRAIKRNAIKDGTGVHIVLESEKTGITQLDYLMQEAELRGYTMLTHSVQGDKLTRASAVMVRISAGKLKLVRGSWNTAFIDELSTFPAGAHDDQVDALTGGYNYLADGIVQTVKATSFGFTG